MSPERAARFAELLGYSHAKVARKRAAGNDDELATPKFWGIR